MREVRAGSAVSSWRFVEYVRSLTGPGFTKVGAGHSLCAGCHVSAREVQILRLVARGLSNRDIGNELVISEHTAANHVRSILRKTGSANRTEAAAYAHHRGLA